MPVPKISIIMPTYNRAGLIMETIQSILDQTESDWELIIVDDGSDDETETLISKLGDNRIQFIKAGRIGIGGRIKNTGLQKARAELIAFIDSDDLWAPGKLEKQAAALENNPGAGFCMTGGYTFTKPGEPEIYFYKEKEGMKVADIFIPVFQSQVAGYTQALMLRRQCLGIAGAFREEGSFSDLEFIIRLASHFKAVILYEPLLYRRLHDSNYITGNWEKSCNEGIMIIKEYKDKLPAAVASDALFRAYIQWGGKYLDRKKRFKAASCFLKAWQSKPFSVVPLKKTIKAFLYFLQGK